jgi:FkbM family methyltransferase
MATNIKAIAKRIPIVARPYRWWRDNFKYLFYFKPRALVVQDSLMYLNVWEKDLSIRNTFRIYAKNLIHEASTTRLFRNLLKSGDTFVDLGANIGYYSMLACRLVGQTGQVLSFEPEPRNFKYLSRNKELNSYSQMTPVHRAVSDKKDVVKLFVCPYDTGHHTIKQSEGITSYETKAVYDKDKIMYVEVETVTLDSYLVGAGISNVDLIKMDVEGAELFALKGMRETIKRNPGLKMIVEFFPILIEKMGSSPAEFLTTLVAHGFRVQEIEDDYDARDHAENAQLRDMPRIEELLEEYSKNSMYHVNLLLSRQ